MTFVHCSRSFKEPAVRAATLVAAVECEQVKSLLHKEFGSRIGMASNGKLILFSLFKLRRGNAICTGLFVVLQ
jgi:hypothetical protein